VGELGRLEVGDGADSWGPIDRDEGEVASSEGANQKGRRISREDATGARLGGPAGMVSACGGSTASGLAGPEAEWAAWSAGLKISKKEFLK
jgi:hypothetical protein